MKAEYEKIWFEADVSACYHAERSQFLNNLSAGLLMSILVSGLVFPIDLILGLGTAMIWSTVFIGCGFWIIVFDPMSMAHHHSSLCSRYVALRELSEGQLYTPWDLERKRMDITRDEPPIYWALKAVVWNEILPSWGHRSPPRWREAGERIRGGERQIPRWVYHLRHIFRFQTRVFPIVKGTPNE